MSVSSLKREEILKWHRSKAATPEYTAKLLGVPLDEVLYIIAHPETPAPHKDDFTPEFIEPLIWIQRKNTEFSVKKNETLHRKDGGHAHQAP